MKLLGGGGEKLTRWGKNGPAYFSPGKKLTGGKFRPVTPGPKYPFTGFQFTKVLIIKLTILLKKSFATLIVLVTFLGI